MPSEDTMESPAENVATDKWARVKEAKRLKKANKGKPKEPKVRKVPTPAPLVQVSTNDWSSQPKPAVEHNEKKSNKRKTISLEEQKPTVTQESTATPPTPAKKRKQSEGEDSKDSPAAAAVPEASTDTAPPTTSSAKKRKRPKTGKPRPKKKLTALQKLKQRELMRTKKLAAESSLSAKPTSSENAMPEGEPEAAPAPAADDSTAKPVRKDLLQTPVSAPGEAKKRKAAVEYLNVYVNNRTEWKFKKVQQVWILRNLWYTHQLSDSEFDMALDYCKGLSHQARQETIEEAKEIVLLSDPTVGTTKKGVVEGNKIKFSESDDEDEDEEKVEEKEEEENDEGAEGSKKSTINPVIVSRAKRIVAALRTFL
ncbi:hypothetical protein DFJ77DRAFT_448391 [Powellomyces hirtus]|nr:hypothetical protein DFJ77DRAFT_448391 [Powellomyces hirtus]